MPDHSAVDCPRCGNQRLEDGALHHCACCGGHWLRESDLVERLRALQRVPAWTQADRTVLRCAVCRARMDALLLWDIPVDRCPTHGVSFESNELLSILVRGTRTPTRMSEPFAAFSPPADGASLEDALLSSGVSPVLSAALAVVKRIGGQ